MSTRKISWKDSLPQDLKDLIHEALEDRKKPAPKRDIPDFVYVFAAMIVVGLGAASLVGFIKFCAWINLHY